MLGSIIGNIIGSIYEIEEINAIRNNKDKKRNYEERVKILDKKINLFNENCSYTDDSVLTTAIADAILNNLNYETTLRNYGKKEIELGLDKYGRNRFGQGFISWIMNENSGNSIGNGSAMRIAPIGFMFNSIKKVKDEAIKATIPSHNSEEAIKGAIIVAETVFLAKNKFSKEEIKKHIENNYCKLDYDLEDLQKNYRFKSNCAGTVPQALYCFLISDDFEDAIRKSISIGGDSDTIACIVGGISEAYYGIPEIIIKEAEKYIPKYINLVIEQFYQKTNIKKLQKVISNIMQ